MSKESVRKKKLALLKNNFPFFLKHAPLKIVPKEGDAITLKLNKSQEYIHGMLENQLNTLGKVRALILKGRQQGASTYIGARFFHKTVYRRGVSTYIMAHDAPTTDKLFKMSKRFFEKMKKGLRPAIKKSNAREIDFNLMDSNYYVGTAGSKEGGRGGTTRLFHGSEVAFWKYGDEVRKGAMQAVPDLSGTEIILESTANGLDPMFYPMVQDAITGKGEYILIFVPWFWQDEYKKTPPSDFEITTEEQEYKEQYDLTDDQIYWRRIKTVELKGENFFKQEYPANPKEAFVTSGDPLVKTDLIDRARKRTVRESSMPVVMGVDPADTGDRTVISIRRGKEWIACLPFEKVDPMTLVDKVISFIDSYKVDACFFDKAYGRGAVSRLKQLGYGDIVHPVLFGESATENDIYLNKRAEMYIRARDWFADDDVSIPDSDDIHMELAMMPNHKGGNASKIKMIPKVEIKKLLKRSPDIFDSFVLTFAANVRKRGSSKNITRKTSSRKRR